MRLLKISTCPCSWGPVIQWDPCIWLTISDLIQCRCILGVYVYWGDIYMCVYWEYICVMHMCICITTNLYHTYLSIYQPFSLTVTLTLSLYIHTYISIHVVTMCWTVGTLWAEVLPVKSHCAWRNCMKRVCMGCICIYVCI